MAVGTGQDFHPCMVIAQSMKPLTWCQYDSHIDYVHRINLNKVMTLFIWKCNSCISNHHHFHVKAQVGYCPQWLPEMSVQFTSGVKQAILEQSIFILGHMIKFLWIIKERIKVTINRYHSYKQFAVISNLSHVQKDF